MDCSDDSMRLMVSTNRGGDEQGTQQQDPRHRTIKGTIMTETELAGRRILLVEDEPLVALLLESIFEDEGCVTIGPYGDLKSALEAAQNAKVDAAVLDVNLAGKAVFPVADVLRKRGVPVVLLSGYGKTQLPDDRRHWPVCGKPFRTEELLSILRGAIAAVC